MNVSEALENLAQGNDLREERCKEAEAGLTRALAVLSGLEKQQDFSVEPSPTQEHIGSAQPLTQQWLPIATAPRDGDPLDLWIVEAGAGYREANARWAEPGHQCGEAGQYCDCCPAIKGPQWVNDLLFAIEGSGAVATHWFRHTPPAALSDGSVSDRVTEGPEPSTGRRDTTESSPNPESSQ